jgi:hypothetical protein
LANFFVLSILGTFDYRSWITSPPVFSTNKTNRHDITAILLKVALNTISQNQATSP